MYTETIGYVLVFVAGVVFEFAAINALARWMMRRHKRLVDEESDAS